ncbi:MAG TPA: DUF5320 domain-containing protein [Anaerolineae bacterium]|nr:DUF5320 domain-containing protein [Anaerolineae bacterium]
MRVPRFDGTGPRGEGPLTGRGEGYCVMRLPKPGTGEATVGYAGMQGTPVQSGRALTWPAAARLPGQTACLAPWLTNNWRLVWRTSRGRRRRLGPVRARRR